MIMMKNILKLDLKQQLSSKRQKFVAWKQLLQLFFTKMANIIHSFSQMNFYINYE